MRLSGSEVPICKSRERSDSGSETIRDLKIEIEVVRQDLHNAKNANIKAAPGRLGFGIGHGRLLLFQQDARGQDEATPDDHVQGDLLAKEDHTKKQGCDPLPIGK